MLHITILLCEFEGEGAQQTTKLQVVKAPLINLAVLILSERDMLCKTEQQWSTAYVFYRPFHFETVKQSNYTLCVQDLLIRVRWMKLGNCLKNLRAPMLKTLCEYYFRLTPISGSVPACSAIWHGFWDTQSSFSTTSKLRENFFGCTGSVIFFAISNAYRLKLSLS